MVNYENGGICHQPIALLDSGSGVIEGSPIELVLFLRRQARSDIAGAADPDHLEGIVFILLHERPPVFEHFDARRSGRRPEF